ncbi:MarR family transcriptional regulator [Candidatus Peregrinibacteria bacterium]|jgi:hypothetical protein|nr:MarR family transcriptional regulator [Candidatus Peregrinibacteria bacterium]MBT7736266.1 MarR family transcriptional regulator [Candidatus Peregrinibacteria bacterium]
MNEELKLKKLLIKSGLSERAADLYTFVLDNEGVSVADAVLAMNYSKSSIYRAFEELQSLGLVESLSDDWKNSLRIVTLGGLIKKLESEKKQKARLISSLRAMELSKDLSTPEALVDFETLNEEETYERYHDLASSDKWSTMMVMGNWEDFNNEKRNVVPIEKKFIKNRIKHGGRALVLLTKEGPYSGQICDFEDLDTREDRKSVMADDVTKKPLWINVFEGTNHLHIWNMNERGGIISTFMDCKPVADFYKDFIAARMV